MSCVAAGFGARRRAEGYLCRSSSTKRCKWRQAAALGRGGAGIGEGRGLKPGAEDLVLFAEAAAGWLSIDKPRERVPSRYRR